MRTVFTKQSFTSLKNFKVLVMFIIFISSNISAQTPQPTDTSKVKKHSPKKAMIMSAIIPGLGQAYNKKYWKIPIIYAGAAVVTYFAIASGITLRPTNCVLMETQQQLTHMQQNIKQKIF